MYCRKTIIEELNKSFNPDNMDENLDGHRYIKSYKAIEEANRIFGNMSWSDRVIKQEVVDITQNEKGNFGASVVSVIEVTVGFLADDDLDTDIITVKREGVGCATSWNSNKGKAIGNAYKSSISDARKRALMSYGNTLGLALYDKEGSKIGYELLEEDLTEEEQELYKKVEEWKSKSNRDDVIAAYDEAMRETSMDDMQKKRFNKIYSSMLKSEFPAPKPDLL